MQRVWQRHNLKFDSVAEMVLMEKQFQQVHSQVSWILAKEWQLQPHHEKGALLQSETYVTVAAIMSWLPERSASLVGRVIMTWSHDSN